MRKIVWLKNVPRNFCFNGRRFRCHVNYPQAIQFLYDLRMSGTKLGLDNTFRLAEMAGNPHQKLRFIHVAGTNGKGSTCAMLESVYRTSGLRTGLFTSPHLVSFSERIQVNRQLIPEDDVARLVTEFRDLLRQFLAGEQPTFFEVVTVMALKYFAKQQCDLVIWETGMGGRLDATNIVTPLASVITNIGLDHQKFLGDTLDKIAFEKAGIIKPGVPALTATEVPEALDVIRNAAAQRKSSLTTVTQADAAHPFIQSLALPLLGDHQRLNAALAVATVHALQPTIPVSVDAMRQGLETVHWAGRLQLINTGPGKTILLDGAHNAAGVETLKAVLSQMTSHQRPALVLGILQDKNWEAMCRSLAPLADQIFLVPVGSERTATPADLSSVCRQANPKATLVECANLKEALRSAEACPFLVITGSLYLVGEALELLQPRGATASRERQLNEWFPANSSRPTVK